MSDKDETRAQALATARDAVKAAKAAARLHLEEQHAKLTDATIVQWYEEHVARLSAEADRELQAFRAVRTKVHEFLQDEIPPLDREDGEFMWRVTDARVAACGITEKGKAKK